MSEPGEKGRVEHVWILIHRAVTEAWEPDHGGSRGAWVVRASGEEAADGSRERGDAVLLAPEEEEREGGVHIQGEALRAWAWIASEDTRKCFVGAVLQRRLSELVYERVVNASLV